MKQNNEQILSYVAFAIGIVNAIAAVIMTLWLPEIVPTHFDINWVCDGVGSRWVNLIAAALPIAAGGTALAIGKSGKVRNHRVVGIIMLVLTAFFAAFFWMMYPLSASGAQIGDTVEPQALAWAIPLCYAAIFMIIGNYMPVIEPNKSLGIRIGWTLNNEQCWRLTHRFAGRLWVITGLLMILVICIALAAGAQMGAWLYILFFEMLLVDLIVPIIYAWKHKDAE